MNNRVVSSKWSKNKTMEFRSFFSRLISCFVLFFPTWRNTTVTAYKNIIYTNNILRRIVLVMKNRSSFQTRYTTTIDQFIYFPNAIYDDHRSIFCKNPFPKMSKIIFFPIGIIFLRNRLPSQLKYLNEK